MKRIGFVIVVMMMVALEGMAYTIPWSWAKRAGGALNDIASFIATDAFGNIYSVGNFYSDSITFGTTTLYNHSYDTADIYLVKYDPNGNVLWAQSAGGTDEDYAQAIQVDIFGDIYISGWTRNSSITFGSVTLVNTSINDVNSFIVKYDSNGNVLWAKFINRSGGTIISTDNFGNIYGFGRFYGTFIIFGNDTLTNLGIDNIFLVKFDSSGNELWAKRIGGGGFDYVNGITFDNSGNILVDGYYGDASIILSADTLHNIDTETDIFIAKYNSNGNLLWAQRVGGKYYDFGGPIVTDVYENIYLAGTSSIDTLFFGTHYIIMGNNSEGFLVKFDSNGNFIWAFNLGEGFSFITSLCVDNLNNIFLYGYVQDTFNYYHIFLTKDGPNANYLLSQTFGISGFNTSGSATLDVSGNLYLSGNFTCDTIIFGFDTLFNDTIGGTKDLFFAKIGNSITDILKNSQPNNSVLIYPNPANTILNIHLLNSQLSTLHSQLIITDVLGNEVYAETLTGIDNGISIAKWCEGVYFYEIIGGNESARGMFIKQ